MCRLKKRFSFQLLLDVHLIVSVFIQIDHSPSVHGLFNVQIRNQNNGIAKIMVYHFLTKHIRRNTKLLNIYFAARATESRSLTKIN